MIIHWICVITVGVLQTFKQPVILCPLKTAPHASLRSDFRDVNDPVCDLLRVSPVDTVSGEKDGTTISGITVLVGDESSVVLSP